MEGLVRTDLAEVLRDFLPHGASPTRIQECVWKTLLQESRSHDEEDHDPNHDEKDQKDGSDDIHAAMDDFVIVSETGSGKTLAYLIPLLSWTLPAPKGRCSVADAVAAPAVGDCPCTPLSLILAPTRELCLQIGMVAEALLEPLVAGTTRHTVASAATQPLRQQ